MSVTATGPLSVPLDLLADMIAASTTFQDWVDAGDAAEAAANVYLCADDPATMTRPFALIVCGNDFGLSSIAGGSSYTFREYGSIGVIFEGIVPDDYTDSHSDAILWFANAVGGTAKDLATASGVDDNLCISSIGLVYGPSRANAKERATIGDIVQAAIEIKWGTAE